jgi:hypothetical protein
MIYAKIFVNKIVFDSFNMRYLRATAKLPISAGNDRNRPVISLLMQLFMFLLQVFIKPKYYHLSPRDCEKNSFAIIIINKYL